MVDDLLGSDAREPRLAHLLAPDEEPAVGEDLARQGQSGGHEHGGPVDSVEAQDVLADEVHVGRPCPCEELGLSSALRCAVPDCGGVVQQSVEPDVDDLALVPGQSDAPGDTASRHRDVDQALA